MIECSIIESMILSCIATRYSVVLAESHPTAALGVTFVADRLLAAIPTQVARCIWSVAVEAFTDRRETGTVITTRTVAALVRRTTTCRRAEISADTTTTLATGSATQWVLQVRNRTTRPITTGLQCFVLLSFDYVNVTFLHLSRFLPIIRLSWLYQVILMTTTDLATFMMAL